MSAQPFEEFLTNARWFAGKGREHSVTEVRRLGEVGAGDEPKVVVDLVEVTYADGDTELYQLPLALYSEPQGRLEHAVVGWWEEPGLGRRHVYDAVHDREAMAAFLAAFAAAPSEPDRSAGPLRFVRSGDELAIESHATLFSGEQSNSSVAFGDEAVLKVFRKITPGENPDITTHRALTEAGSTHVAPLFGWLEADEPVLHLAMLQQFLRTASDGWQLALASARDLLAEEDLAAAQAGGDFAAEAARLGEAVAEVHDQLRDAFPTATAPAADVAAVMRDRLTAAVDAVPELAEHAPRLGRLYDAVAQLGDVELQRVHGDLHLGQTLRTVSGWKLVDFEGEPARPLEQRLRPDSRWRDVAGMIRSFDYVSHVVAETGADEDPAHAPQRTATADEWADRNQEAFIDAYAPDRTPAVDTLVTAYVADKAVYECLYEARNRPDWLRIPLGALARIGAS